MNYLLTGPTGFIGSAIAESLVNNDSFFKVLVRNRSDLFTKNVEQHCFSLENLDSLTSEKFSNVDCVIHSAGLAHNSGASELSLRKVNCDGTLELARYAFQNGVKRFVFLSSIGVHGVNSNHPFTESSLMAPHDIYTQTKIEAELGLLKIANSSDLEVVIIRPPLVYGPNAPGNFGSLVNWVKRSLPMPFGAINNLRSFIALDNLVDFVLLCADRSRSPRAVNQVFVLSDGEDVSTSTLLRKVAKAYGVTPRLLPVPVSFMRLVAKLLCESDMADRLFGNLQVDSSKANELLGWRPVVTMDEQLRKMAELEKAAGKL